MAGSGAGHSGEGAGNALKKGVGIIHGAGEAIRGNINAFADSAVGSKDGMAKDQAIVDRGVDEINTGHYHGTGAGVTPADTTRERQNRVAQGEHDGTGVYSETTVRGPHESSMANKADPRIDSDLGHRKPRGMRKTVPFAHHCRLNTLQEEPFSTKHFRSSVASIFSPNTLALKHNADIPFLSSNFHKTSTDEPATSQIQSTPHRPTIGNDEAPSVSNTAAHNPKIQRMMQTALLATLERFLNKTVLGQTSPLTTKAPSTREKNLGTAVESTTPSLPPFYTPPNRFEQQIAKVIHRATLAKLTRMETAFASGKSLVEIREMQNPRSQANKTDSAEKQSSAFQSLFDTIEWPDMERTRWCGLLLAGLVVPVPVPGALLISEAVRLGAFPGAGWDEEMWDAVLELLEAELQVGWVLEDLWPTRSKGGLRVKRGQCPAVSLKDGDGEGKVIIVAEPREGLK